MDDPVTIQRRDVHHSTSILVFKVIPDNTRAVLNEPLGKHLACHNVVRDITTRACIGHIRFHCSEESKSVVVAIISSSIPVPTIANDSFPSPSVAAHVETVRMRTRRATRESQHQVTALVVVSNVLLTKGIVSLVLVGTFGDNSPSPTMLIERITPEKSHSKHEFVSTRDIKGTRVNMTRARFVIPKEFISVLIIDILGSPIGNLGNSNSIRFGAVTIRIGGLQFSISFTPLACVGWNVFDPVGHLEGIKFVYPIVCSAIIMN